MANGYLPMMLLDRSRSLPNPEMGLDRSGGGDNPFISGIAEGQVIKYRNLQAQQATQQLKTETEMQAGMKALAGGNEQEWTAWQSANPQLADSVKTAVFTQKNAELNASLKLNGTIMSTVPTLSAYTANYDKLQQQYKGATLPPPSAFKDQDEYAHYLDTFGANSAKLKVSSNAALESLQMAHDPTRSKQERAQYMENFNNIQNELRTTAQERQQMGAAAVLRGHAADMLNTWKASHPDAKIDAVGLRNGADGTVSTDPFLHYLSPATNTSVGEQQVAADYINIRAAHYITAQNMDPTTALDAARKDAYNQTLVQGTFDNGKWVASKTLLHRDPMVRFQMTPFPPATLQAMENGDGKAIAEFYNQYHALPLSVIQALSGRK